MENLSEEDQYELIKKVVPVELQDDVQFSLMYQTRTSIVCHGFNKKTQKKKVYKFSNIATEPHKPRLLLMREAGKLQELQGDPYMIQIDEVFWSLEGGKYGFSLGYYTSIRKRFRNGGGILSQSLTNFANLKVFLLDVLQTINTARTTHNLYHLHLTPDCIGYDDVKKKFVVVDWERAIRRSEQKGKIDPNETEDKYNFVDLDIILEAISNEIAYPNYFSPEVKSLAGKRTALRVEEPPKAAIFSLGLVVLEIFGAKPKDWFFIYLFSSEKNYYTNTLFSLVDRLQIPVELRGIVSQMLSQDPQHRPSIQRLIEIIQNLQDNELQKPAVPKVDSIPEEFQTKFKEIRGKMASKFESVEFGKIKAYFKALEDAKYYYLDIENSYYRGPFQNGQREGFGENYFASQNLYYIGFFNNDKRSGIGAEINNEKEIYIGVWENNRMDGYGEIYFTKKEAKYEGHFKNKRANGQGAFYKKDGTIYKTTWVNGKKHGKGVMIKNGVEYEAGWVDGELIGVTELPGVLDQNDLLRQRPHQVSEDNTVSNHAVEKAGQTLCQNPKPNLTEFEEHKVEITNLQTKPEDLEENDNNIALNQGREENLEHVMNTDCDNLNRINNKVVYENNDSYEGEWRDEVWHGKGVWKSGSNSSRYEGNYAFGKKEGKGTMYYANGDVYEGHWKEGKKNGEGKYRWKKDNSVYQGSWVNDKREGRGKMVYANGDEYSGDWKDDNFEGKGTYKWNDKRIYKGNFSKGLFAGKGKMVYSDGDYYEGYWKNSLYCGDGEYYSSAENKLYKITCFGSEFLQIDSEEIVSSATLKNLPEEKPSYSTRNKK